MHIPGTLWQELVITLCLLRHSFLKSILPRPQSSQSKGEAQLLFFLCCKWNDDAHTHEPLVIQLCPPYWKAASWRKGWCPHDKTPSKRCAVHDQAQELLWERTHFPHLHYCSQYPETKWHLGKSSTDPEPETSEVVPEFSVPQELRFVLSLVTEQILSANSEPDPGVGGWGGAVSVLEWRKEASGSWQSVPQRWPLAPCCGLSPGALMGSCVNFWARERRPCSCDAQSSGPPTASYAASEPQLLKSALKVSKTLAFSGWRNFTKDLA